jgi:hypothetical protein
MHSPFHIVQDFLSPKLCDEILRQIELKQPNTDREGKAIPFERHHEGLERLIFPLLKQEVPNIEQRYFAKYKGTETLVFQHFPERANTIAKQPGCENAQYARKKWVKIKDVDLTGFIWLKDFNDSVPLDPRIEVYGGKLEFPAYNFSLQPQRGTLVLFPAGPHFINAISPVLVSDLYQIKVNICLSPNDGSGIYLYQPAKFPGKWQDWLKEFV